MENQGKHNDQIKSSGIIICISTMGLICIIAYLAIFN
jgi:hypothetical protein